jgi:hypothetical protein
MTKARVNADNASADIQGVTAGTGLSGGGTSGTVTITNDMATAIDAKGDLVVGTGADTYDNLAVGANDTILMADSSTATGLKWAAPAASGATLGANTFTADQSINGIIAGRSGGNIASNTVFGAAALDSNTTGTENVAIGVNALTANTASRSTAVGYNALKANTSAAQNTAFGYNALQATTIGNGHTGLGANTLFTATDAYDCTAVGQNALYDVTNGTRNTAVGYAAAARITTGTNNTCMGSYAGEDLTTGSNNSFLGYNVTPSSATVSNTITLGNSSISTLRCQVTSITALSDERDKKNIEPLNVGLDFVNTLKPVTFDWNMRSTTNREGDTIPGGKVDIPDTGFIAQDIIAAEEATTIADHLQLSYRDNPDALEITQGRLIPILVKAIQDLSAKVSELEAKANL